MNWATGALSIPLSHRFLCSPQKVLIQSRLCYCHSTYNGRELNVNNPSIQTWTSNFPSDKLVARSMTLHPWTYFRPDKMKQNFLHLMHKFHKTREVFEEIAHCFSNDAFSGKGSFIWDLSVVKGESCVPGVRVYESCSRCVVSSVESSVQKTSSLAHRLWTPFRLC